MAESDNRAAQGQEMAPSTFQGIEHLISSHDVVEVIPNEVFKISANQCWCLQGARDWIVMARSSKLREGVSKLRSFKTCGLKTK